MSLQDIKERLLEIAGAFAQRLPKSRRQHEELEQVLDKQHERIEQRRRTRVRAGALSGVDVEEGRTPSAENYASWMNLTPPNVSNGARPEHNEGDSGDED